MNRRQSLMAIGAGAAAVLLSPLAGARPDLPELNPNGDRIPPISRRRFGGRWESVHPVQIREGDVFRYDKAAGEEFTAHSDCFVSEDGIYSTYTSPLPDEYRPPPIAEGSRK